MKKLVLAEYERIWARKSTKILLAVVIIFQVLNFLLYQKYWHLDIYTIKKGIDIKLNNLNYPVTQLLDFNSVLIFIILPLYFSECLSLEIDSGAYKMIVLRPVSRWKLLVSKWLALASTYTIVLSFVYITRSIIGNLFMPKVDMTNYFVNTLNFNKFDSVIYNIKYYLIILLIHLSLIGVISVIGFIVKKPLLTFLGSIAFIITSIYAFDPMTDIFFKTTDIGFFILAGEYNLKNVFFYLLFALFCFIVSLFIWNKRINKLA